ncbi:MAG: hypothetical protein COA67_10880 [Lutibacter sp.]|nr:MAG: hypothetical protein COA67_10880 [Lutibacter sp.]
MKISIMFNLMLLFISITAYSQADKNLLDGAEKLELKESALVIKGTSSLHDWTSNVEESSAYIVLNDKETQIEKLNVIVEVKSIKNNKGSSLMDKLTRKALKEKEFPRIKYEFINAIIVDDNGELLKLDLIGELTIAGKTNKVSIETVINKKGNRVILEGSHQLKMTDYGVDPPTALFGTVKTGNEITIDFSVEF